MNDLTVLKNDILQIAGFRCGGERIVSIDLGRRRRNVPDEGDGIADEIDRDVESNCGLRQAVWSEPALL